VARETLALCTNSVRAAEMKDALAGVRERLGAPGASARAAAAVLATGNQTRRPYN
jgi:hypothetical protein